MADTTFPPQNIPPAPPSPPSYQRGSYPPPPPPPPAKKSSGFRILFTILFVIVAAFLGISLLANCLLFGLFSTLSNGGANATASSKVAQDIITRGGPEKIAILPAVGTVDGSMEERIRIYIDAIKADKSIKAVVLEVDSPGGTITASDDIYHMLTELKTKDHYPLAIAMRGLAASGGYYISMAGDKIYAEPTTMTGSIGVIWPAFEVTGLLEKIGVKPEVITSDQAIWKDAGSPFKKFTDEDRAYIKQLVNDAHVKFSKIVETARKSALKVPMTDVAIGRVWTSDDALKMGIIDEIAYLDDACQETATAAGISNPTVVRLKEKTGLLGLLGASTSMGKTEVTLDPKLLFELQTPHMEYRYVDPTTTR